MKKCLVSYAMFGLSVVALPFLGGCTQQNAGTNPFVATANAQPATGDTNQLLTASTNLPVGTETAAAEPGAATAPKAAAPTNAPAVAEATSEPLPPTEMKPPPNVRLSPVLSEVVKLVQSGVEEAVLLSYITNTTGYFALGAEEIVYLNDLGVAGHVVTTMMTHDQALRELRANAWQATQAAPVATAPPVEEPEPEESAAAPSYVEAPAMEAEPVQVSNNYFFNTLAPYGSWVVVPGFGNCWRPTVVVNNPRWRPYCDRGRWVHTSSGWFWLSDYSWGATTFHYGRWFNDTRWGWCWWPDRVWAPSWVSWRFTSGFCGWAPMPPTSGFHTSLGLTFQNNSVGSGFGFGLGFNTFTFVSWGTFCSPRPWQHCLPPSQAVHVFNQSSAVNHFESGGNGRVHNRGIPPDRVREHSRQEVRTVNLREDNGRGVRGERLDRDGRTLAVYRPNLIPASNDGGNAPAPMTRTSGRIDDAGRAGFRPRNDTVVSPTTVQPTPTPVVASRSERRPELDRLNPTVRSVERVTSPMMAVSSPTVETKQQVAAPTTPGRIEGRPGWERQQPVEAVTGNRSRPTSPVVVRTPTRTPEVTAQPVPAAPPTTRVPEARAVQTRPQPTARPTTPAPSTSVVVIGNRNNGQSTGRDYSVWSTPSATPTPSAPAPATRSTRDNFTRSTPSPTLSSPPPANPVPARVEPSRVPRSEVSRPENRNSFATQTTPRPSQSVAPGTRFVPAPSSAPRSVPSSPAPNYTPRPAPSAPASTPRMESRPTPSAPSAAPTTSRPGPNQNRPSR